MPCWYHVILTSSPSSTGVHWCMCSISAYHVLSPPPLVDVIVVSSQFAPFLLSKCAVHIHHVNTINNYSFIATSPSISASVWLTAASSLCQPSADPILSFHLSYSLRLGLLSICVRCDLCYIPLVSFVGKWKNPMNFPLQNICHGFEAIPQGWVHAYVWYSWGKLSALDTIQEVIDFISLGNRSLILFKCCKVVLQCGNIFIECKVHFAAVMTILEPILGMLDPFCFWTGTIIMHHQLNNCLMTIFVFYISDPGPTITSRNCIADDTINLLPISNIGGTRMQCLCNQDVLRVSGNWHTGVRVFFDDIQ